MDDFKSGNGSYIGTSPWAYGGLYRPETQHANAFGEIWAGDPPHEGMLIRFQHFGDGC